jgi:hypothetical protein
MLITRIGGFGLQGSADPAFEHGTDSPFEACPRRDTLATVRAVLIGIHLLCYYDASAILTPVMKARIWAISRHRRRKLLSHFTLWDHEFHESRRSVTQT